MCSAKLVLTPVGTGKTEHIGEEVAMPGAIELKEGLFEVRRWQRARRGSTRIPLPRLEGGSLLGRYAGRDPRRRMMDAIEGTTGSELGCAAHAPHCCCRLGCFHLPRRASLKVCYPCSAPSEKQRGCRRAQGTRRRRVDPVLHQPAAPLPLHCSPVQLGRADPADIIIAIPTVSTRHAMLRVADTEAPAAGSVQVSRGGPGAVGCAVAAAAAACGQSGCAAADGSAEVA